MKKQCCRLLLLLTLFACSNEPDTYRIGVRWVPETLTPRSDSTNGAYVFYNSLYYPLFETENQSLKSHFIDLESSGATSSAFNSFRFCLKPNLLFSDGSPIRVSDLELAIQETHQHKWYLAPLASTQSDKNCLKVALKRSDPLYLHHLASRESTILKKESSGNALPIGIGPYAPRVFEREHIVFEAIPGHVPGSLKRLEWLVFELSSAPPELLKSIDDWNSYDWPEIPPNLVRDFQTIRKAIPLTVAVDVQHPNRTLRQQLSRCLDREGLIRAENLTLNPRGSLFPEGVLEQSNRPVSRPNCSFKGTKPLIVYYAFGEKRDEIRQFFADTSQSLPFDVKVEFHSPGDTFDAWKQNKSMLTIEALDAPNELPESFLARLVAQDRPPLAAIPGLKALLSKAVMEGNSKRRQELMLRAHDLVLENATLIPLGQSVINYRFRPTLYNVMLPNWGNGVPLLHLIKRRRWAFL